MTRIPATANVRIRQAPDGLPLAITRLFKGVVYRETDEKLWQRLVELPAQARDYVAVLGP